MHSFIMPKNFHLAPEYFLFVASPPLKGASSLFCFSTFLTSLAIFLSIAISLVVMSICVVDLPTLNLLAVSRTVALFAITNFASSRTRCLIFIKKTSYCSVLLRLNNISLFIFLCKQFSFFQLEHLFYLLFLCQNNKNKFSDSGSIIYFYFV